VGSAAGASLPINGWATAGYYVNAPRGLAVPAIA